MTKQTTVGFIGLGIMGGPMAANLVKAGFEVIGYNRSPEKVKELVENGGRGADDVASAVREADVVITMVPDSPDVESVTGGSEGVFANAREGALYIDMSTIRPDVAVRVAEAGREAGVRVLDAPVSGGPMGAADGTLAIMVGGDEATYAVAEPVLTRMGSKVVHAGPLGAGTRMKLARNLIHFVAFTAVTEAQRLAEAGGLDLVALGEVVRHTDRITGGPGAIMYRDTTAKLDPDEFWHSVFDHVRALGEKDLSFAIELAGTLGVDVPLAQLARENLAKGLGL
jgi:3-hydroxyisobutyrate dehydrogenase-like beta-hydroxyacid dehydrogenase